MEDEDNGIAIGPFVDFRTKNIGQVHRRNIVDGIALIHNNCQMMGETWHR